MFGNLFAARKKVSPLLPAAKGGQIHGHLFENPKVGIPRNIYWAINVELEPFSFEGEEQDCFIGIEWLLLPIRSWTELDGVTLASLSEPDLMEASVYLLGQHWPANIDQLEFTRIGTSPEFRVRLKGSVSIDEPGIPSLLNIDIDTGAAFTGVIAIPENLALKASDEAGVVAGTSKFVSTKDLGNPVWEDFRFVLPPALDPGQAG